MVKTLYEKAVLHSGGFDPVSLGKRRGTEYKPLLLKPKEPRELSIGDYYTSLFFLYYNDGKQAYVPPDGKRLPHRLTRCIFLIFCLIEKIK